jgi:hypothetical protein
VSENAILKNEDVTWLHLAPSLDAVWSSLQGIDICDLKDDGKEHGTGYQSSG